MNFVLKPWQFALIVIAGWMNREQQQVIEYLRKRSAGLAACCQLAAAGSACFRFCSPGFLFGLPVGAD